MSRILVKPLIWNLKGLPSKIILSRFRNVKTTKTKCRHQCPEKEQIYWPLTLDRLFTITLFDDIFTKPASNDQASKFHKSVWCNMQHRSVWWEMLSGEITESVSRCNHSARLRTRELLKDTDVDGFGVGWGINGNFSSVWGDGSVLSSF